MANYQFNVNLQPASFIEALYRLKEQLKTAGWIHQASSDGTTFITTVGNVNDKITGFGTSGAGNWGAGHGWWIGAAPGAVSGSTRQICIERVSSDTAIRIKYSYAAGFTGGSPSATQTPSATDEQLLQGSGTNASPTGANIFSNVTAGLFRWHICANSASPYEFYAVGTGFGNATPAAGMMMDYVSSANNLDNDPYVLHWLGLNGLGSSTSPALGSITPNVDTTFYPKCWFRAGMTNSCWAGVFPSFVAQYINGLAINAVTFGVANGGGPPSSGFDEVMGSNIFNGLIDIFPTIWYRPEILGTTNQNVTGVAVQGYKGISTLLHTSSAPLGQAQLMSRSTAGDTIFWGAFLLPWNGTNPLI